MFDGLCDCYMLVFGLCFVFVWLGCLFVYLLGVVVVSGFVCLWVAVAWWLLFLCCCLCLVVVGLVVLLLCLGVMVLFGLGGWWFCVWVVLFCCCL